MPPQPSQRPSFLQQLEFAKWFCQFPALIIALWLRRDTGYRLLNPFKLFAATGILFVVAILATPGNEDARPTDLAVFAALTFVIGLYQRIRRWIELNKGVHEFSYYIGTSPFDFCWLPNFIRRNRRVARFVDPMFCLGVGLALHPYSRALAMWLIFSAFCLRSFEYQVFVRQRNRDMDLYDSLVISERQSQILDQYEQGYKTPQHQTDSAVPTGMSEDVQAHIQQRRAKAANKRK